MNQKLSSLTSPADPQQHKQFVEDSKKLADIAGRLGIHIVPFFTPELPYFHAASDETRRRVLDRLELTIRLSEELEDSGRPVHRSTSLIWSFFKVMGLTPTSDFHAKIGPDDLVDVYNEEMVLIFANLNFFEITSYSLEDLYFRPWHDLFQHRPQDIQEKLLGICQQILINPNKVLVDVRHCGPHTVVETRTPERLSVTVQPTFFSPLTRDGKVVGFACVNQVLSSK